MKRYILTIVEEKRTEVEIYAKSADDAERYYKFDKTAKPYESKNGSVLRKSVEKHEVIKPAPTDDIDHLMSE